MDVKGADDMRSGPAADRESPNGNRPGQPGRGDSVSEGGSRATGHPTDDPSVGVAPLSPSYTSPGRSALLRWPLVAALTVVSLGAGIAYGAARPQTFTASSYLYVGKTLSLTQTSAIPGLAAAATSIAEDYSRLITTASVTTRTAQAIGRRAGDLGGSLSASVIAQTPEVIVTATSRDPAGAVRIANAGSSSLVAAVDALNVSAAHQLDGLKNTYVSLEQQINANTLVQQQLQSQFDSATGSHAAAGTVSVLRRQLATVETTISTDTLNAQTAESQYSTLYSPLISEEQVLQPVSAAVLATGNRKRGLEVGGAVGLFGGLLLGVLVASGLDLRQDRRGRNRNPTGSRRRSAVG